jgi:hypothetical protein
MPHQPRAPHGLQSCRRITSDRTTALSLLIDQYPVCSRGYRDHEPEIPTHPEERIQGLYGEPLEVILSASVLGEDKCWRPS